MRAPGTDVSGKEFDEKTVRAVWLKSIPMWGMESFRRDMFGTLICRFKYGQNEKQGWEIDHIIPVSKGGTDDLSNLQSLYWKNNRQKGDHLLKAGNIDWCQFG